MRIIPTCGHGIAPAQAERKVENPYQDTRTDDEDEQAAKGKAGTLKDRCTAE